MTVLALFNNYFVYFLFHKLKLHFITLEFSQLNKTLIFQESGGRSVVYHK